MQPHVKVGNRYRMDDGAIEVDSIVPMTLADITPELARASGFKGVVDLLKVAKHGRGENVYLVRFHYVSSADSPATGKIAPMRTPRPQGATGRRQGRAR